MEEDNHQNTQQTAQEQEFSNGTEDCTKDCTQSTTPVLFVLSRAITFALHTKLH